MPEPAHLGGLALVATD
ncbi:hypothetical protein [Halorubrum hochstenium]